MSLGLFLIILGAHYFYGVLVIKGAYVYHESQGKYWKPNVGKGFMVWATILCVFGFYLGAMEFWTTMFFIIVDAGVAFWMADTAGEGFKLVFDKTYRSKVDESARRVEARIAKREAEEKAEEEAAAEAAKPIEGELVEPDKTSVDHLLQAKKDHQAELDKLSSAHSDGELDDDTYQEMKDILEENFQHKLQEIREGS